jgi:dTMP kinase
MGESDNQKGMAAKWVVLEGLDGAGTTTQARLLIERLRVDLKAAREVFATAEPTTGPLGELCRSALRGKLPLDPRTLALAFTADRSHHLYGENGLLAHRERGCWIVQDRYLYSTLAYQDGVDREWIRDLNSVFPRPDLVVFLDTPIEVCLERIAARGKSAEMFEKEDSLRRVAESYRWVFESEKGRAPLLVLDGSAPVQELNDRIYNSLMEDSAG